MKTFSFPSHFGFCGTRTSRCRARRGGFTLLQIVLVVGLLAILASLLIGQFGRSRAAVSRAQCDVHLKSIVLALDTYHQETGHLPTTLMELVKKGYLPLDTLRCPADPDLGANGKNATYSSYEDFYVLRDPLDDGDLPILVCPFHEKDGLHGAQGYKGGYTKTFAARPAVLSGVAGAVTVTRPGDGVLAIPASGQLEVRGGDHIRLGAGQASLTFADGSVAALGNNSEMSVLESYLEGQTTDSIYTMVRQFAGTITYSVVPGNKFDVATPTATAGALGTVFTIEIVATTPAVGSSPQKAASAEAVLTVLDHAVAYTCQERTIEVDDVDESGRKAVPVRSDDPANKNKRHSPRNSKAKKIKKDKKATDNNRSDD